MSAVRAPLLLLCALATGCIAGDSGEAGSSRLLLSRVTFDRTSALGYRAHVETAHRFARDVALLRGESRGRPVMIECHTDAKGSPQFNQGLSQRRARTMRDILINAGIDPGRLRTGTPGATRLGTPAGATTVSARPGDMPLTHNRYCDLYVI
ncbi:MAG: OmpA family protein [Alphaproteobacteria bacterium]|nr:OmpA family protein [Alphaproteobacteria bacterium]MCW5743163.1 OmpA family protein [Alphaproteobacteria bacterium]